MILDLEFAHTCPLGFLFLNLRRFRSDQFRYSVGGHHTCLSRRKPGFESPYRNKSFCLIIHLNPTQPIYLLLEEKTALILGWHHRPNDGFHSFTEMIFCGGRTIISCFYSRRLTSVGNTLSYSLLGYVDPFDMALRGNDEDDAEVRSCVHHNE